MRTPNMLIVAKEGLRMAKRAKRIRASGFIAYNGSEEEICRSIISDAYDTDRKYFRVSGANGHFCEFYMRDFGLCCESLAELGYEKEVRATLEYALKKYMIRGKITTAISPKGEPFDYFLKTGPDALAFLLYSITHTKNEDLIHKDPKTKDFIQEELNHFAKRFIDSKTLLPKQNLRVSSIRDQAKRRACCYDAVMIAIVAREAKFLKMPFLYKLEDIKSTIVRNYWNGVYFFQDLDKQPIVAGDANVFPFWSGIIDDEAMLKSAMDSIDAAGLNSPFPLRYISSLDKQKEKTSFHLVSALSSDYETDSIWMHLGLAYLRVLSGHDPKKTTEFLNMYSGKIKEYKTFLEVYDTNGVPFHRMFYASDEAMMWCANYLTIGNALKNHIDNERKKPESSPRNHHQQRS